MPTSSTYQTVGMKVHDGLSPAIDLNGFIADIAYKFKVTAKTASYTVTLNDSGTLFTTRGATANVVFTLPAVASATGCMYRFFNAVDFNMTITSAEGTTIMCKNNAGASSIAFSTTSEKIGASCKVISDGTSWLALITSDETTTLTIA